MMILYLFSVRGEGVFDYRRVVELLQGHRVEFLLQLDHLLPVLLVKAVHNLLAPLPRVQQLLPCYSFGSSPNLLGVEPTSNLIAA